MSWVSHLTAQESLTASNQEVKHCLLKSLSKRKLCLMCSKKSNSIKSTMPRRHSLGTFSLNKHNVGGSRLAYVLLPMHSDLFSKLPMAIKGVELCQTLVYSNYTPN